MASKFQQILGTLFAREDIMSFDQGPMDDASAFSMMGEHFKTRMELGSQRLKRYKDYKDMAEDTLISGALDLYADESTQRDHLEDATVWVDTHSEKVDSELRRMFAKTGLEEQAWGISRSTAKDGDFFLRPLANKTKGIVGMEFLDAEDVERVVDRYTQLVGFRVNGFGDRLFDPWAFIHFRILGRTQSVKHGGSLYGTSMLENARRTWRQLCLASGTRIWTSGGYKKIEDVRPGDTVYCHDPDLVDTYETMVVAAKPMGRQKLVRVQTEHRELLVTPNHGLLAKQKDGTIDYKKAEDLVVSDGKGGWSAQQADQLVLPALDFGKDRHVVKLDPEDYYVHLKEPLQYESEGVMDRLRKCGLATSLKNAHAFLNAKRGIRMDDWRRVRREFRSETMDRPTVVTFGKSTKLAVSQDLRFVVREDFMRLLGFMLGDGWVNEGSSGRVGFALGENEERNAFYIDLFQKLFHVELDIVPSKPNQGGQTYCGSNDIVNIFQSAGFITGFANKEIPAWVFEMSPKMKFALVQGIFDADGCYTDGRITLANEQLSTGLHTLCQQIGVPVSRKISTQEREGRQKSYRFWLSLEGWSGEKATTVYERVTHVEPAGEGETYDIQVEDEVHNFVADGVVSHNTLLEDTLIIYRLEIGGRHRIFYVDVGGLSHEQALATVRRYQRQFGKKEYFNPTCVVAGTKIHTLDGKQPTIKEMVARYEAGEQLWVYSYDTEKRRVVPGKVLWAGPTNRQTPVVKVTLDNGETIRCTPNHPFLTKTAQGGREYVEASDLKPGTSITPLNLRRSDTERGDWLEGYLQTWQDDKKRWQYVHRAVATASHGYPRDAQGKFSGQYVVHHKDHEKDNNQPENLQWMTWAEHFEHHEKMKENLKLGHEKMRVLVKDPEWVAWRAARAAQVRYGTPEAKEKYDAISAVNLTARNQSEGGRARNREVMSQRWAEGDPAVADMSLRMRSKVESVFRRLSEEGLEPNYENWCSVMKQGLPSWASAHRWCPDLFVSIVDDAPALEPRRRVDTAEVVQLFDEMRVDRVRVGIQELADALGVHYDQVRYALNRAGLSIKEMNATYNHKVVSVEFDGVEDVYDLTIETHHNFAIAFGEYDGVFTHNTGEWTSRFNPLNLTADIFWPIRRDSQSRIEYLGTDPNVASIADVDYFRDKLFASLRVPKAYIGGEEYSSVRFGLSQVDISFARLTKRLQRSIINGITRMAQIHLAIREIKPLDPENAFDIVMTSPSSLDQEQRMEALEMSLNLAMKLKQVGDVIGIDQDALSSFITKTVLGLSPYDLGMIGQDRKSKLQGVDKEKLTDSVLSLISEDPGLAREVRRIRYNAGEEYLPLLGEGDGGNLFPEAGDRRASMSSLRDVIPEWEDEGSVEADPFAVELTDEDLQYLRPGLTSARKAERPLVISPNGDPSRTRSGSVVLPSGDLH